MGMYWCTTKLLQVKQGLTSQNESRLTMLLGLHAVVFYNLRLKISLFQIFSLLVQYVISVIN